MVPIGESTIWFVDVKGKLANSPCCGQRIYDNRGRKRTPRSPDLRCSGCGKVAWLQPDGGWRWADPLNHSTTKR